MEEIDLDLSVCVVAGRERHSVKALRALLNSIHQTADPVAFEILVAEQGESGAAALADEFPGLLVSRLGAGLSPFAAGNQLMRLAKGRYAAWLEGDVIVQPGCLHRLVDFMDENPEVGLAGPRIIDAYGATAASVGNFPRLLAMMGLPLPTPRPRLAVQTGEVDWRLGGFHLMRRELIEEIGLWDEACGTLAELDLYWRARRHGWHSYYLFEAVALQVNPSRYRKGVDRHGRRPARGREIASFVRKRWLA